MKKLVVYGLILLLLPLTGCPLLTQIPVDNGSYDVPAWLRGRWREVQELGKPEQSWLVERDLQKGHLTIYAIDSEGKPQYASPKKVIMSNLGGKAFACVQNTGDDGTDEGYYLYEFRRVSNREFVLAGIKTGKVPYLASTVELWKFLKDNMHNPDIYDPKETTTYKRTYPPAHYTFD